MKLKRISPLVAAATLAAVVASAIPPTTTTFTWSGAGSTGNLNDPANWDEYNKPNGDGVHGFENLVFGNIASGFHSSLLIPDGAVVFDNITFGGSERPIYTFNSSISSTDLHLRGDVNVTTSGNSIQLGSNIRINLNSSSHKVFVQDDTILTVLGEITGSITNLKKKGSGTLVLGGNNSYTGKTTVYDGVLQIGNGGATGELSGDIAFAYESAGSIVFNSSGNHTYAGRISGSTSSNYAVIVEGTGATTFTGHHTYYGDTVIKGTLVLDGSSDFNPTLGYGTVTVASGTLDLLNNASIGNTVNVESGARIGGTGFISTATIGSGATLAPGDTAAAGIGVMTFDDLTLAGNGTYVWHLQNPNGEQGLGWDVVNFSSPHTLHLDTDTLSAANRFNLKLITLDANGNPGTATGFLDQTYEWTIFNTSGTSISPEFDPDYFALDSSLFSTDIGPGTFDFALDGRHNLVLNFTPVPEPSTYVLMGTGLSLLAGAAWRRKRR